MKSGTTTLHSTIGTHPEIFMTLCKEPNYFLSVPNPEHEWFDDHQYDSEGRWYLALFEEAHHNSGTKYAGESSTDYTKRPVFEGCSKRISAFNPEARILYVMRDPVERSISHYWHNTRLHGESRSMIDAARSDPHLIDFSDYAMQLKPYFETFPREQIHVLSLESFRDDRDASLRAIFEWLGVRAAFQAPAFGQVNETLYQMRPGMNWLACATITRRWHQTTRWLPQKFHGAVHKLAFRPKPRDPRSELETIQYLRPILLEKTRTLTELIGREFREWKTLYST
jgi:hypothetical protein